MQSGRCESCFKPALVGKSHCLDHHKEQSNYSYGLDHDIQKKMASKFDPNKAAAARIWIEAVTKRQLSSDLHASLKSGVVLCELINAIFPGSVSKINQGSMPFVQRENIVAYLSACKARGQRETDVFVTQDLFEGDNMNQVIDQICGLGQLAAAKGWKGAQLVISGGAVQVATSSHGGGRVVQAPAQGQVPLTSAPYQSPSSVTPQSNAYKPAPSFQPSSSVSSPPPQRTFGAPSPPASSAASAAPASGPKFCGDCGTKRTDLNAKFCGECGKKFL